MAVEAPGTIFNLNPNWPQDQDFISEGAPHIRLVKTDLKNTFPAIEQALNINDKQVNSLAAAMKTEPDEGKLTFFVGAEGDDLTGGGTIISKDGTMVLGKEKEPVADLLPNSVGTVATLFDLFMPIGHIITWTRDTNPKDFYAQMGIESEWTQIKGRVLMGFGDATEEEGVEVNLALKSKGGKNFIDDLGTTFQAKEHALTMREMPSHTHRFQETDADGVVRTAKYIAKENVDHGGADFPFAHFSDDPATQHGTCASIEAVGGVEDEDGKFITQGHTHEIEAKKDQGGNTLKYNNLTAYYTIGMWERTA